MARDRDNDALSWDGDDDPTLVTADESAPPPPPPLPEGWRAVGRGAQDVGTVPDEHAPVPDDGSASHTAAAQGDSAEAAATSTDADPERTPSAKQSAGLGNGALIALGILAGVHLLYAIGWLIGGLRLEGTAQYLVSPTVYRVGVWLSALAPLIWLGVVMVLTRRSRSWVRFVWLVAGILLLIPWPFVMVGTVGQ